MPLLRAPNIFTGLSVKWTRCDPLHRTACHTEQKLSGAREAGTGGYKEGRTGAKWDVKAAGDLQGKAHTSSVHELVPHGNWQVGKAE